MKKTYKNPTLEVVKISSQTQLLAFSATGNEYNSNDVTYGRDSDSDWDDEY